MARRRPDVIEIEPPAPPIVRRSVRVDGRRISYLTVEPPGTEGTIVLVHGSAMSARYWTPQILGLAAALRVLALDLPGHGESDPIAGASVDAYAGAVAKFLAALGTGTVIMAGHSLGGAVALALTARCPRQVRGLVLLSSCARLARTRSWAEPVLACAPDPVRKLLVFMMARKILFAPGASTAAIGLGMSELLACRPDIILKDLQVAKTMDLTERARGLDVPALIMCGSRDSVTPPALSQRLHALIRRSRLDLVEGSGHMLLLEHPERVTRAIADFSRSLGAERPDPRGAGRSWRRRLFDWARALVGGG